MKVLKKVFNELETKLNDKQKQFTELQNERNERREEGDLKENEEFQRLSEDVTTLAQEITDLLRMKEEAIIVEETSVFNLIDVGCMFKMTIINKGDCINGKQEISEKALKAKYYPDKDITVTERILCMGGPLDNNLDEGIFSCDSPMGKFLQGKSVGEYRMPDTRNTYQNIKIEYL